MAKFNEILVGRFSRGLQKLFAVKGTAPVPILGTEVQAVLAIHHGVEGYFLDEWRRYGFSVALAPITNGAAQIRNPSNSNVIAVIEQVHVAVQTSSSQEISMRVNTGAEPGDLTTIASAQPMDRRETPQLSSCILSFTTGGVSLGVALRLNCLANDNKELIRTRNQEIVLAPGDALRILNQSAAIPTNYSFQWRERFLEESERK